MAAVHVAELDGPSSVGVEACGEDLVAGRHCFCKILLLNWVARVFALECDARNTWTG
jgi:hypothetical protein